MTRDQFGKHVAESVVIASRGVPALFFRGPAICHDLAAADRTAKVIIACRAVIQCRGCVLLGARPNSLADGLTSAHQIPMSLVGAANAFGVIERVAIRPS